MNSDKFNQKKACDNTTDELITKKFEMQYPCRQHYNNENECTYAEFDKITDNYNKKNYNKNNDNKVPVIMCTADHFMQNPESINWYSGANEKSHYNYEKSHYAFGVNDNKKIYKTKSASNIISKIHELKHIIDPSKWDEVITIKTNGSRFTSQELVIKCISFEANQAYLRKVISNHPECINKKFPEDGMTLLHLAILLSKNDLISWLICPNIKEEIRSICLDLMATNSEGETPLRFAIRPGDQLKNAVFCMISRFLAFDAEHRRKFLSFAVKVTSNESKFDLRRYTSHRSKSRLFFKSIQDQFYEALKNNQSLISETENLLNDILHQVHKEILHKTSLENAKQEDEKCKKMRKRTNKEPENSCMPQKIAFNIEAILAEDYLKYTKKKDTQEFAIQYGNKSNSLQVVNSFQEQGVYQYLPPRELSLPNLNKYLKCQMSKKICDHQFLAHGKKFFQVTKEVLKSKL